MKSNQVWIDSHSHLFNKPDVGDDSYLVQVLERARQSGIQNVLQGGIDPQDWDRQEALSARHPEIWTSFGIHPYFVADHTEPECEVALNELARRISSARALGETGLDFRPHIMKDSQSRQLDYFHAQLDLAKFANKAVVLHVVQAFEEAFKMVETLEEIHGFVHGFNGSAQKALAWCELGIGISVGAAALKPENERLHQALRAIPEDFLMVESDDLEPISIIQVAEKISSIRKVTKEVILGKSRDNLLRILNANRSNSRN